MIQIKSLLQERDRFTEEARRRQEAVDCDLERSKELECRLVQALAQKQGAVQLLERVREALPSTELQRIFGELV